MSSKIRRTVCISLICASLVLFSGSSKQEPNELQKELTLKLSQDANISFDDVCYFASWKVGKQNYIAIMAYNNTNIFSSEEEQYKKFRRIDYIVSNEDFEEVKAIANNFEAIVPFSNKLLKKLINITENYNPASVSVAKLNKNGEEIITQTIK